MTELLKTPLHDWHVARGGRMVEFGGWSMPVQYAGIVDEHHAVRKRAGLFDISHMGRLRFRGPDAGPLLESLVTCAVDSMRVGQIRYGLMCRDDGGVLDDVLVYRFASDFGLVVNAGNREKIVRWIEAKLPGRHATMTDESAIRPMIALQGPRAVDVLRRVLDVDVGDLKFYWGCSARLGSASVDVSRTGYTGEDGFELIVDGDVTAVWNSLLEAGSADGATPCGLGCRDTLRLEAAMPLYGHELSESIDPLTAGLDFAVKLTKSAFIGQSALQSIATRRERRRVGLVLGSRRIAREGSTVHCEGKEIGVVTSGTHSPTLEQSIAMAYVDMAASPVGTIVEVDVRGKREPATVVALPFYRRA